MNRTPVTSSNIKNIGYDPDTREMQIEFINGTVYAYAEVEEKTYNEVMKANSVGRAFNQEIRGQYLSVRIEVEEPES